MAGALDLNRLEIIVGSNGIASSVVLNGEEIKDRVSGIVIKTNVRDGTSIWVEYPATRVIADVTAMGDHSHRRVVLTTQRTRTTGPLVDDDAQAVP